MMNFIIVVVLCVTVGVAISYIVKEKKRGVRCIGCPSAGTCQKRSCGCYSENR